MSGSPAPQTTTPNTVGISGFFTDPGFDFVTRSMIGYAAQGVMDVGRSSLRSPASRTAMPTVGTPHGGRPPRSFTARQKQA